MTDSAPPARLGEAGQRLIQGDGTLLPERLARLVEQAVQRAQAAGQLPRVPLPEVAIERPKEEQHGDFATSFAMRARRAVGTRANPLEIAGAVSAALAEDMPAYLAAVEVSPPGFINFSLADDWVREQVDTMLSEGPSFGSVPGPPRGRVQVEFVSANPTGPLHVGTGRNAALGDSIARVLARTGWQVQREYYFNDAGAQMEHLFHSVWVRYQQALGHDVPLAEDDYPAPYVVELAEEIRRDHGDRFADLPEERAAEIGSLAAKRILAWIETDLERLRIHFDSWFSEARVIREGDFDTVMDVLRSRDLVYERDGAVWLRSQDLGDDRDRVLIRTDQRPTYTATDIAYHYDKFFVRGFDRVIDIWGEDHHGQVPSMKGIVKALGAEPSRFDIVIYRLVTVLRNGQPVRMGKRAGNIITVGEVLDEVGADAMRWFLISRNADARIEFDIDLAKKQSSENPVYYVQYAHARLARVLADARPDVDWRAGKVALLTHPTELALIRRMLQLPEVVDLAARQLAPHHVPHYAYELARATTAWYEAGNDDPAMRVLVEKPALRAARLKLAAAARQALANALDLIGVSAPEAM
jgi:arginyl-tRNA synthetase